jgi:hypothetical protein
MTLHLRSDALDHLLDPETEKLVYLRAEKQMKETMSI